MESIDINTKSLLGGLCKYRLKNLQNEPVEGTFYSDELQKILRIEDPDRLYKIEHVIRKRKLKNGKHEVLVKWFGYPAKFNSWIAEQDLVLVWILIHSLLPPTGRTSLQSKVNLARCRFLYATHSKVSM